MHKYMYNTRHPQYKYIRVYCMCVKKHVVLSANKCIKRNIYANQLNKYLRMYICFNVCVCVSLYVHILYT